MKEKNLLLDLFLTFFKIGALTFGGGYAMMPIMHKEVVDKKHWVDDEDVIKMLVISESTPGVFAINSATFIGYKIAKFKGALVATLGVVIPSLITISIITIVLEWFQSYAPVQYALKGIQVGAAVIIFSAAFRLSKKIKFTPLSYIILAASFLISIFTNFSVIYIILIAAIFGIILGLAQTLSKVGEANDH